MSNTIDKALAVWRKKRGSEETLSLWPDWPSRRAYVPALTLKALPKREHWTAKDFDAYQKRTRYSPLRGATWNGHRWV